MRIRTKLTSVSVGIILFTAIVLIATSTLILRRTLASQVETRTQQIAAVVEGEVSLRRRELEHAADLLANNEQFKNLLNFESWNDTTRYLADVLKANNLEAVVLLDREGKIQLSTGVSIDKAGVYAATRSRTGLKSLPQSIIETIAGNVYVVAAQKVELFQNVVGELVLVQAFDNALATKIHKKTGAQVIAFTEKGAKASSMELQPKFDEALQKRWPDLVANKHITLGSMPGKDGTYFTIAEALPNVAASVLTAVSAVDGAPIAAIAVAVPESEIAEAQRRTLLGALAPLALFTLIAGLLALALANQIASPIAAMADQFSRISASGDLSLRVQESEGNEIGDMAKSFNAMQERVEQLHGRVVQAEERMRKELQMASTVQEMLFQQVMPHNRACDVAAYTSTLVETSGDWYAVFDDPDAKRTVFVIADATGHGASAALLTAITHGFFQTMVTARQGSDTALARIPPAQLLSMLNQVVLNSAHGTITATVFVGVLHHGTRKMVYASAGHIPPILTRWVNNEMKANILSCNPSSSIGSAEKPVYEDYTVDLPADSLLLIYTDGLTEIENPQGMQWGVRKLISVLRGCQTDTVESVRQKVLDSVMTFARGKELQDDVTWLTIRVL